MVRLFDGSLVGLLDSSLVGLFDGSLVRSFVGSRVRSFLRTVYIVFISFSDLSIFDNLNVR